MTCVPDVKGCNQLPVVMHEMLHTIGMMHEQSRPDRDDQLIVHRPNDGNFKKMPDKSVKTMDTPYDFKSIMHYSLGKDMKLKKKDEKLEKLVGAAKEMSKYDKIAVEKVYGCLKKLQGGKGEGDKKAEKKKKKKEKKKKKKKKKTKKKKKKGKKGSKEDGKKEEK